MQQRRTLHLTRAITTSAPEPHEAAGAAIAEANELYAHHETPPNDEIRVISTSHTLVYQDGRWYCSLLITYSMG
jgi:hypothetical protein